MSGPVVQGNINNAGHLPNNLPPGVILTPGMILEKDINRDRMVSPVSHADSSDGSTTVSATSSPGVDLQEEREHSGTMGRHIPELAFKAVEDLYKTQQIQVVQQQQQAQVPVPHINIISKSSTKPSAGVSAMKTHSATSSDIVAAQFQQQNSTTSSNGNIVEDVSPRKKPRKQNM